MIAKDDKPSRSPDVEKRAVLVPFHPRFVRVIKEGAMTMTARRRAYGSAGDVVASPAGPLKLVEVRQLTLDEIATRFWLQAGARSPRDFIDTWNDLTPESQFRPNEVVWLHEFRLLGPDEPEARA